MFLFSSHIKVTIGAYTISSPMFHYYIFVTLLLSVVNKIDIFVIIYRSLG